MSRPVRTCSVCRSKRQQSEFVRIRLSASGELHLHHVGAGRSAYACNTRTCLDQITEKGFLERSLRKAIAPASKTDLREKLLAI